MTHRNFSVALLAGLTALTLSACGSAQSAAPAAPTSTADIAAPTTTSEVVPTVDLTNCRDEKFFAANQDLCVGGGDKFDGPATEPATFQNGLVVRIVSVAVGPADPAVYGQSTKGEDTLVTVTTEITNNGKEAYAFPQAKMNVAERLVYSPNEYDATGQMVYDVGRNDLPAQLVPGTSATTVSRHTIPAFGKESMKFHFSPDAEALPTYTFTDVQALAQ